MPPPLAEVTATLLAHHGPQSLPAAHTAFELILWDQVAYLAPQNRRQQAFDLLRNTVGTDPSALLRATDAQLLAVTQLGVLPVAFAEKLRLCAQIALCAVGGDLDRAVAGPLPEAKRTLCKFPGMSEAAVERVLLLAGPQPLLGPESNGLRVLERLDLLTPGRSWTATWASHRPLLEQLPVDITYLQQAHLVLQRHGQTLCRAKAPRCGECPLRQRCLAAVAPL